MNKSLSLENDFFRFLKFELKSHTLTYVGLISISFFIVGSFINIVAYSSLEPILVGFIF